MAAETDIPETLSQLDIERTKYLVNGTRKLAEIATKLSLKDRMHVIDVIDFATWSREHNPEHNDENHIELQVPDFYANLTPAEIAAVQELMTFPIPDREYSNAVVGHVNYWATSLLQANVSTRIASHTSTVSIQAINKGYAYTEPGHLREHHEARDSMGSYRPSSAHRILRTAILGPIIDFGQTLEKDVEEEKKIDELIDKL